MPHETPVNPAGSAGHMDALRSWRAGQPAPKIGPVVHRYPIDIGHPPHEKQMLFEAKKGRHLGRRGNVGEAETPDDTVASAALYMPADALNTATAVNWDEREIGIIGGAIIESFATGDPPTSANIVEKLKDAIPAGLGGAAIDVAAKLITPLISTATAGGDGKAILQSMFGQQVDPRLDMLFNRVQYRTHTFTFTLIPRNQREAENINQILNLFQFYMLPKYGSAQDGSVQLDSYFIGYPYEFDITLITGGGKSQSPHINKIDRSVLTSCTINHASSQRVAFVGAYYPASTSLTLDFKEVRLQGRDSYNKSMWHGDPSTPHDPNGPMTNEQARELGGTVVTSSGVILKSAMTAVQKYWYDLGVTPP